MGDLSLETKDERSTRRAKFMAFLMEKKLVAEIINRISGKPKRIVPATECHKYIRDLCREKVVSVWGYPSWPSNADDTVSVLADNMEVQIVIKPKQIPLSYVESK